MRTHRAARELPSGFVAALLRLMRMIWTGMMGRSMVKQPWAVGAAARASNPSRLTGRKLAGSARATGENKMMYAFFGTVAELKSAVCSGQQLFCLQTSGCVLHDGCL